MTTPILPISSSVIRDIHAPASKVWQYISDPSTSAMFSNELQEAGFLEGAQPSLGAVISGRNRRGDFEWSTLSTVIACDEPVLFSWAVGDVATPVATWTFAVTPNGDHSKLTHSVTLHEHVGPMVDAAKNSPDVAPDVIQGRLDSLLRNMQRTVDGIATLCEN